MTKLTNGLRLAAVAGLCAAASLTASVEASAMSHGKKGNMKKMRAMHHANPMPNLMRVVARHGDMLNLTPEQDAALSAWRKENNPKAQKMVKDIRAGEKELMTLSLAGAESEVLMKKLDAVLALRRDLAELKTDCRDNMQTVLNKKQFAMVVAQYMTMQMAMNKGKRKGMGMGMGMGKGASASAGDIKVTGAFARQSFRKGGNSAAFMMLKNTGSADNVLVAAKSDVARKTELHTHINENGVFKMREVKGGIVVKAGGMTHLKPGGFHVMLIGLNRDLKPGDKVKLTLEFKSGASATLMVPVRNIKRGHMMHN